MSILDLYCSVDAFWQHFEPLWEREMLASGHRRRRRATRLHPAEILTILILFQQSGYRTFKGFYTQHVQAHLRQEFPELLSYPRFVALMPRYLVPLAISLHTQLGECWGVFGDQLHRLDLAPCLSSRAHPAASRLPGRRPPRQDVSGLVLWVQTPPGRQRPWRLASILPHTRQYGRPPSCSCAGPSALWTPLRR
jgi:hypothetical protein